jgi:hypothetical protein
MLGSRVYEAEEDTHGSPRRTFQEMTPRRSPGALPAQTCRPMRMLSVFIPSRERSSAEEKRSKSIKDLKIQSSRKGPSKLVNDEQPCKLAAMSASNRVSKQALSASNCVSQQPSQQASV